jgi:signal recognition particle GTPase
MRADPDWQAARAIPHSQKETRSQAYRALRAKHRFSDYALQEAVKDLRVAHLDAHVEAVVAQVLATRAYRALNRVALGQAKG